MTSTSGITAVLWFIAILVMIPLSLWLFKRSPMGGMQGHGLMRQIAALPISQSQRIVTVEVGTGDDRRWLVLGVTAQSITTLHTMAANDDVAVTPSALPVPPFAQMLAKFQARKGMAGER